LKNGNGLPHLRVLFVDDSAEDEVVIFQEISKSFKVILKRVQTEADMRFAMEEETWDIVLCAYKMEHFSPYKALEILNKSKKDLPFIVILLSDIAEDEAAVLTVILAGARDVIDKESLKRLILTIKRELRLAAERMQHRVDINTAYDRTVLAWGMALELRDHHTSGHTQRVADTTLRLARRMDMTREQLVNIHRGALLHDVGKMGVPDLVLLKEGPLDNIERDIMRMHPQLAYNMLMPVIFLRDAIDIPYCHHEKWDGSGYPRGLKGDVIPLAARIFSVVDVYDALTSDRPYRKSWTKAKALEHITSEKEKSFEPTIADKFIEMVVA